MFIIIVFDWVLTRSSRWEGWMIFSFLIVHVYFLNWISLHFFHILQNTTILCVVLWHFDWVLIGRRNFFCFMYPLSFFPYSRLSFYPLHLFLWLISFLLFPYASVWKNTRTRVPRFLQPYWMVLVIFRQCNYKSNNVYSERKSRNTCALVNLYV